MSRVRGLTTANTFGPTSLSVDFVGGAKVGDWLEGRAEIVRAGRSLAFANCHLDVGDRRIARASSVLAVGASPLLGQALG